LGGENEGGCMLDDGPSIAPETAQRLSCDSAVVCLKEREGETVTIGRKARAVPPPMRRALRARDLDNLVLLCRRHHRLVHEGGYTVETYRAGAGDTMDLALAVDALLSAGYDGLCANEARVVSSPVRLS
jgi:hypothetical protein